MGVMPRRSQKKRDAALADLVTARYRGAADARIPRVIAWDKSYDDHDPAYVNRSKVKSPPYVKFPYCHRVTLQQSALLMEANDANGRWNHALPTTTGTREAAEAVTEFLEVQYRQKSPDFFLNNRAVAKRVARMGLKYGNSYYLAQWERRRQWWGVRWTSLNPRDVYLDASHGRFYIVRRVVTLGQLNDLALGISSPLIGQNPETGEDVEVPPRDGGRALKAVKRVEKEIKAGNSPTYIYDATWDGHGNSTQYTRNRVQGDGMELTDTYVSDADDPFNAPICVLEYYETHGEGLIAKIIPGFDHGENLVFQAEQNPYGVCPIVPFVPHPVDNEYYGLGNGEVVGGLAGVMDWALRGELAMIGATAWAPLLYKSSAHLRKQYLKSIYGLAIEVKNQDDIGWMQPPSSTGIHTMAQNVAQQAADFGTGESDVRRGDVGSSRSATASAIAETAGNVTDRDIYSQWRDTQEQLGHVCLAIAKVHIARTELIPILGRNTERFYKLKPEFLEGQWEVQFGGNPLGANTTQQISATLNILSRRSVRRIGHARVAARGHSAHGETRPGPLPGPQGPAPAHVAAGRTDRPDALRADARHLTAGQPSRALADARATAPADAADRPALRCARAPRADAHAVAPTADGPAGSGWAGWGRWAAGAAAGTGGCRRAARHHAARHD